MRRWGPALALLSLAALSFGQEDEPGRGRLVEGLACRSDPTQTYSLYLPSSRGERPPPCLIILDPRGRSVHAAGRFREAAEKYGWVLLSSNDSRSDTPTAEANVRALRALWPEAWERYGVDRHRTYLAGFSGTAKFAWAIARSTDEVAGVVVSGAGWEPPHFDEPVSFPSYGTAGSMDFNYTPMREVHARLREWGTPERLEVFEGTHAWMPTGLARQAIEWMEVQAIKRGLRPNDETLVARLLEEDLARAAALEAAGSWLEAQRRYRAAADTFEGLLPVTRARREAARLEGRPEVDHLLKEERRWDRYEESMWRRHREAYNDLRGAEPPLRTAVFSMKFGVGEINGHAGAEGYEGVVGRRLLETLATNAGYYLAGELMQRGEHGRAAVALAIALEARPERPGLWYNLACSQARVGARGSALDALEEAVARGFTDVELITSDEDLKSLREEDRFKALVHPR